MGQSLSTRIAARIELMERWVKNGIPKDLDDVPTSLNGWRIWHKPGIGIMKIGSKNKFTTTDTDVGTHVSQIDRLLQQLNRMRGIEGRRSKSSKPKKGTYKPEKVRRLQAQNERDDLKRDLEMVTGQWHGVRDELSKKDNKLLRLTETNSDLHAQIKELEERVQYLLEQLRNFGLREV